MGRIIWRVMYHSHSPFHIGDLHVRSSRAERGREMDRCSSFEVLKVGDAGRTAQGSNVRVLVPVRVLNIRQ